MKLTGFPFPAPILLFLLLLEFPLYSISLTNHQDKGLGFCSQGTTNDNTMATIPGGLYDSDTDHTHSLAQFAVDQHNNKENALLELVRVVKSQEQVVAGKLHHLTLEVNDAGEKKLYEAKIWVKAWMNFKELEEFKHIEDIPSSASSEHDAKKDGELAEWRSVSVQDPVVQDAAHHAIKMIQQRSNSLLPYVLSEILHANAQVVDSFSKFDMLLKVKRGGKEEKFKVEVHQSDGGNFLLSKMNAHHP